jgi:hypothetical protein
MPRTPWSPAGSGPLPPLPVATLPSLLSCTCSRLPHDLTRKPGQTRSYLSSGLRQPGLVMPQLP